MRKRRRNPWLGSWLFEKLGGSPIVPAAPTKKKPKRRKPKKKTAKRARKRKLSPCERPMTEREAMKIITAHLKKTKKIRRKKHK